jgi:hypothetical protein
MRGIAPPFASPLGLTTHLLLLSMLPLFDPPRLLSCVRSPLDDAYQDQDQHDDEEQTQPPTGVIAPACAIWPGRERRDEQYDQYHEQE